MKPQTILLLLLLSGILSLFTACKDATEKPRGTQISPSNVQPTPKDDTITKLVDDGSCATGCGPQQVCKEQQCFSEVKHQGPGDGTCETPCKKGFTCALGKCVDPESKKPIFVDDGSCSAACKTGEVCQAGNCVAPDPGICPNCTPGFRCDQGVCKVNPQNALICGGVYCDGRNNARCLNNKCVHKTCHPDCGLNQICVKKVNEGTVSYICEERTPQTTCTPECTPDQRCDRGVCVQDKCTLGKDCRSFESCISGHCKILTSRIPDLCKHYKTVKEITQSSGTVILQGDLNTEYSDSPLTMTGAPGACSQNPIQFNNFRMLPHRLKITTPTRVKIEPTEGSQYFEVILKEESACKGEFILQCAANPNEIERTLQPGTYFIIPETKDVTVGGNWKLNLTLSPLAETPVDAKCKQVGEDPLSSVNSLYWCEDSPPEKVQRCTNKRINEPSESCATAICEEVKNLNSEKVGHFTPCDSPVKPTIQCTPASTNGTQPTCTGARQNDPIVLNGAVTYPTKYIFSRSQDESSYGLIYKLYQNSDYPSFNGTHCTQNPDKDKMPILSEYIIKIENLKKGSEVFLGNGYSLSKLYEPEDPYWIVRNVIDTQNHYVFNIQKDAYDSSKECLASEQTSDTQGPPSYVVKDGEEILFISARVIKKADDKETTALSVFIVPPST